MKSISYSTGFCFILIFIFACYQNPSKQKIEANPKLEELSANLDSVITTSIVNNIIPGAVLLISKDNQIVHHKAYGYAKLYEFEKTLLDKPMLMAKDQVFDLASLTKVFATTFGIMILADQGKIDLDAIVKTYLPEFSEGAKDSITIKHLLTHTAGLFPWKPIYYHAQNSKASYQYISELPLAYPVGKERHYSDLGFMLLGYIIERVSGQSLHDFLTENLYRPLQLQTTSFNPNFSKMMFAATSHGNPFEKRMVADDDFGYLCSENPEDFKAWRNYTLVGEVNDGNAYYANGGIAGHAGLFSDASDLQVLLQVLIQKGKYQNQRFISQQLIERFLTEDEFGHGLGWAMSSPTIPVENLPEEAFGHTGFTGTYTIVLPICHLSIIFLTNRQNLGVDYDGRYKNLTLLRKVVSETVINELCG